MASEEEMIHLESSAVKLVLEIVMWDSTSKNNAQILLINPHWNGSGPNHPIEDWEKSITAAKHVQSLFKNLTTINKIRDILIGGMHSVQRSSRDV